MNENAAFWDKLATKYAQKPVADQKSYESKIAKTRAYLTPESKVLEVGCGTGSTAILHAPYAAHITATDISQKMLAIAAEKTKQKGINNITYQQCSAYSLNFKRESFDMVMAHSLLHLVDDPQGLLRNFYELITPGGVVVTNTVCNIPSIFAWILPFLKKFNFVPYIKFLSSAEVIEMHKQAGFIIEHQWSPKASTMFIIAKK